MAKRLTTIDKWKNSRWFRVLDPYYKLAWEYINAICDTDGTWPINLADLIDDLRIKSSFNILDFIAECNTDFDTLTGEKKFNPRIVLIDRGTLLITGFIRDQLEGSSKNLNLIAVDGGFAKTALMKLASKGVLNQALAMGFLPLNISPDSLPPVSAHPLATLPQSSKETLSTLPTSSREALTTPLYIYQCKEKDKEIIQYIYSDVGKKNRGTGEGRNKLPTPGERVPDKPDLPEMTKADFKTFKEQVLADEVFCDSIMSSYEIKNPVELKRWVDLFNAHIAAEKKTRKDFAEYQSHFKNWMKTQDTSKPPTVQRNGRNGHSAGHPPGQSIPVAKPGETDKYAKPHTHVQK